MNYRPLSRRLATATVGVLLFALFPASAMADSATHFVVTAPASASVGSAVSVTVTAKDDSDVTDSSYNGSAVLTSTDGGIVFSPASPVGFTSGSVTFDATFSAVGSQTITATDAGNSLSGTSDGVTVGKGNQTISFGGLPDLRLDQVPATLSATASSGLPVTFTSATTSVCTTSGTRGTTVTLLTAGQCTIDANQGGNGNWNSAPTVPQSFSVTQGNQTISFGGLPDLRLDQVPATLSATASSGLPVTFTSATTSVCTTSGTRGTTVTLLTAGQCTIDANQGGDSNWFGAPMVPQSFTVSPGNQTITFAALPDLRLDQSPTTVNATASSGLPVDFSSTTPSVCTTSGTHNATVTLLTLGTCTIRADQGGNGNWNSAPAVSHSFNVGKGNQTINFPTPPDQRLDQSPATVSATASSGLPVDFSSTTPSVCTTSGSHGATVTLLTAGVCTIDADQGGDGDWNDAPTVPRSFNVTHGNQTITFGALSDLRLDQSPTTVSATASSGLAVTFTSATPSVCTTSGTHGATVTLLTLGTCTIDANQSGNGNWSAAPMVPQSFSVTPGNQTISFAALPGRRLDQSPTTVSATASSGLPVDFSSTTPSVCTTSGTHGATVTLLIAGTCTIDANQAGNGSWFAAPMVPQSFLVSPGNQTITFGALPGRRLDQSPTTVSATASSGLAVTFTSVTPSVCTTSGLNGTIVTLLTAGPCTIDANQAGDTNWNAATMVPQTFTVSKGNQTITFGALTDKRMDESPVTVSATASSGLPVTFNSATPSVCTASGANGTTILLVAIGTCTIQATQAGDTNWNGATTVPQSFQVSKGNQTIAFTSTPPAAYLGGPTYTPVAPATSGLAVTITVDASSTTICQISAGVVSFLAIGTCVLNANQAGNANWFAAAQAQQSFPVGSGIASSLALTVPSSVFLGAPFTVTVTARDNFGNVAGAYVGTVHFTSTDPTAGLPANYTFLIGEHGVHTFTAAVTLNSMGYGTRTLTATDVGTPSITGTSPEIGVGPVNCTYHPLTPARLLDSRVGTGLAGAFSSHVAQTFQVTGRGGVPSGASAVTGNLTVTQQTRNGFLYIGPVANNNPTSSTLNFPVGDDRANAVTVALGTGGTLSVTYVGSGPGTAYVIFDVTGYFTPDMSGATYYPLNPTRILDTRAGIGGSWVPLSSHVARTFQVTGGVVPSGATAVTGNLTVTQQTYNGFMYIGPIAANNPTSSTLNFPLGDDRANSVTVALGDGTHAPLGSLSVTYAAAVLGPTAQVIFDVTGYFKPGAGGVKFVPLNPARILDTRDGTGGMTVESSHVAQTFTVKGHGGVPTNATAISGNLTVTQQTRNGFIFMGPIATNDPTSSTLNFPLADDRANAVTVSLSTVGSESVTYVGSAPGTAQVIFDVTGYFVP